MSLRYLLPVFGLFLLSSLLSAQPARISGIVNTYSRVIGQDYCNNSVMLDSAGLFAVGDRVLLIQIRGASFDSADAPGFGTIREYGGAGLYEMGTIDRISIVNDDSTAIVFRNNILNNYDPRGRVQLVRVPQYDDVIVEGRLYAPRWDSITGGVIAIEARGTITLEADIDASGLGFFGAFMTDGVIKNCSVTNYKLPAFGNDGALKGEGIAEVPDPTFAAGRGALANGGGGGNNHNSGGGGGGNVGAGGQGGFQWEGCGIDDIGGRGGRALDYGGSRIFFGGGAGAGHTNNSDATDSGHGGGIVILRAGALDARGHTVSVEGFASHGPAGVADQDASSGGGAGGVIVADVDRYLSEVFYRANGGKGGDSFAFDRACHGTGGGGGGGLIDIAQAMIPSGVNTVVSGGRSGVGLHPLSGCFNMPYGAVDGENGLVRTGRKAVASGTVFGPSSGTFELPMVAAVPGDTVIVSFILGDRENLSFSGARRFNATIRVDGSVALPLTPGAIRQPNGDLLIEISGEVNDSSQTLAEFPFLAVLGTQQASPLVVESFEWSDSTELRCPLFVTSRDGELLLTVCQQGGARLVGVGAPTKLRGITPNPANGPVTLTYDLLENGPVEVTLVDISGAHLRTLYDGVARSGSFAATVSLDGIASGEYFVVLRTATEVVSERFRVVR